MRTIQTNHIPDPTHDPPQTPQDLTSQADLIVQRLAQTDQELLIIQNLKEKVRRLEADIKDYSNMLQEQTVRKDTMQSAAKGAAQTAVAALDRLVEFQKVVDAAVDWCEGTPNMIESERKLRAVVEVHQAKVRQRS